MATCSIIKNLNEPIENKALLLIIKDIIEGKYKTEVEQYRDVLKTKGKKEAEKLKTRLPAFTPSGIFEGSSKAECLTQYSGFICLDFDHIKEGMMDVIKEKLKSIEFTFAFFVSPSGNGIKVFVEVSTGPEDHEKTYLQVAGYYENLLGIKADRACKNINRLCFVSDDPEGYRNLGNRKYVYPFPQPFPQLGKGSSDPINSLENKQKDLAGLEKVLGQDNPYPQPFPQLGEGSKNPEHSQIEFDKCVSFTEKKVQYLEGSRNVFIHLLGCNCNRRGIPEYEALDLILTNFTDLPEHEVRATVRSAYNGNISEFGKYAKLQSLPGCQVENRQGGNQDEEEEDQLKMTPYIPDKLYAQLPELLKSCTEVFTDKRERDVFLTGALAILSGCMPNVKGVYDQQTFYPNLYSFIIAGAASGKGVLKFAKKLADKYHEQLVETGRELKKQYDAEMNQFKVRQKTIKKNDPIEEPPTEPSYKVVFIPANTSYAKIITHLEQNQGEGIICETEADTMGNVFKQDWGGYSDILRKAFQHERISSSKKTNSEYIEVNEPRLSVALTGTPSQVSGIIESSENGLFSRFLFYVFKVEQIWRDVSPNQNGINLTEHFEKKSIEVLDMITFLKQSETTVLLRKHQWDRLNSVCSERLMKVTLFDSEDAGSIVKRLGLILFRTTMILSAIRKYEDRFCTNSIYCTDTDLETAIELTGVFLEHSLIMFHNLPKQSEGVQFKFSDNKKKWFDELPQEFKRSEAEKLGKIYKLSKRTVGNLLRSLVGKYLEQPGYGMYRKC